MKRRHLLLYALGLSSASPQCSARGQTLEPLHSATARFHDPLAKGVIDRQRWIVDSLPGAEASATNGSLRLVITDGLTATARPRLPTRDPVGLDPNAITPIWEDLQWEAMIDRRLPYLNLVTLELAPYEQPWRLQLTERGVQIVGREGSLTENAGRNVRIHARAIPPAPIMIRRRGTTSSRTIVVAGSLM